DSPPPRPLTDFEDPVYIPPLTLAATLVDDYGAMGAGSNSATNSATVATASTFSRSFTAPSNSLDLLSDFTASYNYLFGTLPSDTGMLSPASTQGAGVASSTIATANIPDIKIKEKEEEEEEEEEEEDVVSSKPSSISEDSALLRELDEERRKEDERKAAEQRNRRRELIKQQVAFERMKERHRRQYPGQQQQQQQVVSAHNSVARWQKESASNAAINRGYAQALPPHHASNHPHVAASSFANLQANASMPNMAYMHKHQGFPLIDTHGARAGMSGDHHSASFAGYVPPPVSAPPATLSAHPVKLASMPQPTKNPYLSDSSDDNVDADSDSDLTSIGSSDISCEPSTAPLSIISGGSSSKVPRSVSQPILASGGSDTSSDTSAKSQSSSTRRVRFHETVSVVFNTRHTVGGEDLEPDAHESDNDSSNASIDLSVNSVAANANGVCSSDEAFDGSNAYSHSRYQIPPTLISVQSEAVQWYDEESTT
ncbi:hypothetical protein GGI21_005033, partial [Coemansia aciculifera]